MQPTEESQQQDLRQRMIANGRSAHAQYAQSQSYAQPAAYQQYSVPAVQPVEQPGMPPAQYQQQPYYQQPAVQQPYFQAPAYTPQQEPSRPANTQKTPLTKSALFGALVKATVEVERVTRQSMQSVKHTFEPPHISAMRTRRQKMLVRGFYALGSASFVTALFLGAYVIFYKEAPKTVPQNSVLGVNYSNNDAQREAEAPVEKKPSQEDMKTYLVAPQYPRYIRIPSMQVEARIRRLGITTMGAVSTPNNINDAGWYDASVKPGESEGASVIEGHVAGPTQHGIFWDISKITVGSSIEVEKGNGEIIYYKVTKTEKVPNDKFNMQKYLTAERAGKHDLKLITASGKYNSIGGVNDERIVVYAQRSD